jgi:hypothetical protein
MIFIYFLNLLKFSCDEELLTFIFLLILNILEFGLAVYGPNLKLLDVSLSTPAIGPSLVRGN